MELKLELIKDLIAIKEIENPFIERKKESGLILLPGSSGLAHSQETGELEVMQKIIGFGIVHIVGPDCKSVKVGDGIYYDRRAPQPVPFKDGYWVINEGNIRGYVSEDENGSVAKAVEIAKLEAEAEDRKNAIAAKGLRV